MILHTMHVARFALHRNEIASYFSGNLLEFPMLHLIWTLCISQSHIKVNSVEKGMAGLACPWVHIAGQACVCHQIHCTPLILGTGLR